MPRRYRRKRGNGKRSGRFKYARRNMVQPRRISSYFDYGLPRNLKANFKYCEIVSLNPTAGGISINVFSANGMYDPNVTGVGHQPRGFDQLMALYANYTVIASVCKATYHSTSTTDNTICGISVLSGSSTTTLNAYQEGRYNKHKASSGTNSKPPVVTIGVNIARYDSVSKIMSSQAHRGTSTANPNEGTFYHVYVAPPDLTDPSSYNVQIELEYIAILTNPITPGQS